MYFGVCCWKYVYDPLWFTIRVGSYIDSMVDTCSRTGHNRVRASTTHGIITFWLHFILLNGRKFPQLLITSCSSPSIFSSVSSRHGMRWRQKTMTEPPFHNLSTFTSHLHFTVRTHFRSFSSEPSDRLQPLVNLVKSFSWNWSIVPL